MMMYSRISHMQHSSHVTRTVARRVQSSAFSLVELVIVIVIIGIIAAIAVPRFSAATGNATDVQVRSSVTVMQKAMDLYLAEHPTAPAKVDTDWATNLSAPASNVLTNSSDAAGDVTRTELGPYLNSIPSNQLIHATTASAFVGGASAKQGDNATNGWAVKVDGSAVTIGYFDKKGADEAAIWP